jgi:cytochrome c oxidase assembly protein subunit 15
MRSSDVWLHRYAIVVAIATIVLIYAGGLVTSTDSGLSVPDWPLSYGQVFPEMVGGVFYEHGHRMVAATVGLLTVILSLWLWRTERRAWVRRLGLLAVAAVIVQGVLGGITVLLMLPKAVSIAHAALAQMFLCLTVALAVFTSPSWHRERSRLEDSRRMPLRHLTGITTAAIYVQILLGALVRHTASGLAIPDFPLVYGGLVPPFFTRQILVHYIHRIGALAVTILVLWVLVIILRRYRSEGTLMKPAVFLAAMLVTQIYLGGETVWSSRATVPMTLHVAVGAVTLAASLVLALNTHRVFAARQAAEPVSLGSPAPRWS